MGNYDRKAVETYLRIAREARGLSLRLKRVHDGRMWSNDVTMLRRVCDVLNRAVSDEPSSKDYTYGGSFVTGKGLALLTSYKDTRDIRKLSASLEDVSDILHQQPHSDSVREKTKELSDMFHEISERAESFAASVKRGYTPLVGLVRQVKLPNRLDWDY